MTEEMQAIVGRHADEVRLLLQEALRATESHEWLRSALMRDRDGNLLNTWRDPKEPPRIFRALEGLPITDIRDRVVECDAVAACCTVGYIDFADICLAPLRTKGGSFGASYATYQAVAAVLWSRDAMHAQAEAWWNEEHGDEGYYSFEEWLADYSTDEIGGEGLVPWWNDTIAVSVEDVRTLFREVLDQLE